jgi:hypothetical protein
MSNLQPSTAYHLVPIILELSRDAFYLAQQAAQQPNQNDQLTQRASDLDQRLQAVAVLINHSKDEKTGQPDELLTTPWTEARLDVDFILSDGSQPISFRLHHFLTELASKVSNPANKPDYHA